MFLWTSLYVYNHLLLLWINVYLVNLGFEESIHEGTTEGTICSILSSLASYRLDTCLDSIDITHSSYEQTDSKSERGENNTHRICCSLFVQLICRFFVMEVIPTSTPPPMSTSPSSMSRPSSSSSITSTHYQQHISSTNFVPGQMCDKSDPSCIRTEMYSRIKVFRQTGCDAFMTHLLITESNDHTNEDHTRGPHGNQSPHYYHHSHHHFQNMKASSPITRSDKQFMLWTMREVLVSCIEVDSMYARGILAWFTWMLRGQLSCNKEKERKSFSYI